MKIRGITSSFALAGFISVWLAPLAHSAPQDVARRLFPRTVLLTMKDLDGRPLSLGSGFVLKPGYIVSNFHVVEGAGSGLAKRVDEKTTYRVIGIVAKDESRDLVILAVEGIRIDGVTLSKRSSLDIGETVFAIGNPRGLEGTFSQGIVSSIRELENATLLQITAPISPGSSGGPIADEHADVVGVAVATFTGGQNLNFAVPAKYVSALAEKISAPVPLANGAKPTQIKSLFSSLGSGGITDAMAINSFLWQSTLANMTQGDGRFSVSLRNNLRVAISAPVVLLLFHNTGGEVVDYSLVSYNGTIPAGMAKRVSGQVDPSVVKLTTALAPDGAGMFFSDTIRTKLVYRTLSFSLEGD